MELPLHRRYYLTLVAAGAIPATAIRAQAATGYGSGGYGEVEYGSGSGSDSDSGSGSDDDSTDDSDDTGDTGDGDSGGVGDVVDDYPEIQTFELSDTSPPNPHVALAVEWSVSHADSALAEVYVEARSQSGRVVGTSTTTVDGAEASGTDLFNIDHATGDTFVVSIFVTDTAENTTTDFARLDTTRRSSTSSRNN